MQNLHDDNHLDDLSRRAAEEFEPDHELHSWDKLRPHLDAALPQKKERKRRFFFWLFLGLLVGGGVALSTMWNRGTEPVSQKVPAAPVQENKAVTVDTKTTQKVTAPIVKVDKPQAPVAKTQNATTGEPITTLKTQQPKPYVTRTEPSSAKQSSAKQSKADVSMPEPLETELSKTEQPKIAQSKTDQSKTDQSKTDQSKTAQSKTAQPKPGQPVTEQSKTTAQSKTTEQSQITEQPQITAPSKTPEQSKTTEQLNTPEQSKPVQVKKEEPKKEQPAPAVTAKKENKNTPSVSNNRWELGLAFAPDVSTVKFTHSQDPGSNIGITIGYNLSKRFQIQTGVFYTAKNYKSYGKDYHPPKGYWTDYVKLETVTAECDMWDVPLNLRYNIVPRQSSNFFASAGLSSYFMKKEDYDFFYYYNGNPVNRFRSYYSDNKHWFSVMNLSVGYERQVGKHVSVQAEPFFKQPLTGLGFGKVRLNSTGIYFSVKYKLQGAKK